MNLGGAAASGLADDWGAGRDNGFWPAGGRLHLDGFTYGRFTGSQLASVEQRLAWIRGQFPAEAKPGVPPFATQPYEQLAAIYRQAGQDTEARKVAIARRSDLRKFGELRLHRKAGDWLLDKSIKYGYQTWRRSSALSSSTPQSGERPTSPNGTVSWWRSGTSPACTPVPVAAGCTSNYPCFYPAGYAIDVVTPIINVHQADSWGPNWNVPWGWAWAADTWAATGLGWALATLLFAGYTGLARRQ